MTSQLELALRELESATAAVAAVAIEDSAEATAAMDRRSWAIADLCALTANPGALTGDERDDIIQRLRLAFDTGENTARRLLAIRNEAAAEWSQWSRIYRALGASASQSSARVDCHALYRELVRETR